jgi:hypothetical protein
MDNRLKMIGEKEPGLAYIEIQKLQTERLKLEAIPEPGKINPFQDSVAEMEKALQAEVNQVVANIVQTANQSVSSSYSNEDMLDQAKVIYRKEAMKLGPPYLMLQCLPMFKQALDHTAYSHDLDQWSSRFKAIDGLIKGWKDKIPVPFSPDLINKNERFPIDRIGMMSNGTYFDRWLSELLKSKPILFNSNEYPDRLVDAYELYKKTFEGEQKAEADRIAKAAGIQQGPEPPYVEEQKIPDEELKAMWEKPDLGDYGMNRLRELRRI